MTTKTKQKNIIRLKTGQRLAATWKDPEMIILNEVSQTEGAISYDIYYMWTLKTNDTNELTYKRETDSQTSRTSL